MKKFFPLLLVTIISCSNQLNPTNSTMYKSFLNDNYIATNTKITKTRLSNSYFKIESLEPYKENKESERIKSDFHFDDDKHNEIRIDKILLSESQKQVDKNGIDSIMPDYSGKNINLTIQGKFDNEIFESNDLFFINEPNLLHLSYSGEDKPKTKILLDNSIIFSPISSSKNYINITLNTKSIPDLYLKGLHNLTIISDKKSSTTKIRIGEPINVLGSLSPQISKVEVLKSGKNAMALKITGQNLMLNPKFSYSKVDGKFSKGYKSDIISTSNGDIWETVISLQEHTSFFDKTDHILEYYSPFGLTYIEFKS